MLVNLEEDCLKWKIVKKSYLNVFSYENSNEQEMIPLFFANFVHFCSFTENILLKMPVEGRKIVLVFPVLYAVVRYLTS